MQWNRLELLEALELLVGKALMLDLDAQEL